FLSWRYKYLYSLLKRSLICVLESSGNCCIPSCSCVRYCCIIGELTLFLFFSFFRSSDKYFFIVLESIPSFSFIALMLKFLLDARTRNLSIQVAPNTFTRPMCYLSSLDLSGPFLA